MTFLSSCSLPPPDYDKYVGKLYHEDGRMAIYWDRQMKQIILIDVPDDTQICIDYIYQGQGSRPVTTIDCIPLEHLKLGQDVVDNHWHRWDMEPAK